MVKDKFITYENVEHLIIQELHFFTVKMKIPRKRFVRVVCYISDRKILVYCILIGFFYSQTVVFDTIEY